MISILEMPLEILDIIMEYCYSTQDVLHFSRVCRTTYLYFRNTFLPRRLKKIHTIEEEQKRHWTRHDLILRCCSLKPIPIFFGKEITSFSQHFDLLVYHGFIKALQRLCFSYYKETFKVLHDIWAHKKLILSLSIFNDAKANLLEPERHLETFSWLLRLAKKYRSRFLNSFDAVRCLMLHIYTIRSESIYLESKNRWSAFCLEMDDLNFGKKDNTFYGISVHQCIKKSLFGRADGLIEEWFSKSQNILESISFFAGILKFLCAKANKGVPYFIHKMYELAMLAKNKVDIFQNKTTIYVLNCLYKKDAAMSLKNSNYDFTRSLSECYFCEGNPTLQFRRVFREIYFESFHCYRISLMDDAEDIKKSVCEKYLEFFQNSLSTEEASLRESIFYFLECGFPFHTEVVRFLIVFRKMLQHPENHSTKEDYDSYVKIITETPLKNFKPVLGIHMFSKKIPYAKYRRAVCTYVSILRRKQKWPKNKSKQSKVILLDKSK